MVPFAEVVLLTAMEYHRKDDSHGPTKNVVMEMKTKNLEDDEACFLSEKRVLPSIVLTSYVVYFVVGAVFYFEN